jgi:hypothetical protein
MLPFYNWSEDEWVELGPGSKACLEKMFGPEARNPTNAHWAMRYLRDQQFAWYTHVGAERHQVPRLSPHKTAGLSMVDIEHSLCECEKYTRGLGLKGVRSQVGKRQFVPRGEPLTAALPPHWLMPGHGEPELPRPPPVDDDGRYEVSHIVGEKDDGKMYRIRWTGWGIEDDTWEPREEIESGSPMLVQQWTKMKQRILAGLERRRRGKASQAVSEKLLTRSARRTTM